MLNKLLTSVGYKTKTMKRRESNETFNRVTKEINGKSQAISLVQTYGLLVGSRAWSSKCK